MRSTKIGRMEDCEQCGLKVHICVVCLSCLYPVSALLCSWSFLWYCLIKVTQAGGKRRSSGGAKVSSIRVVVSIK